MATFEDPTTEPDLTIQTLDAETKRAEFVKKIFTSTINFVVPLSKQDCPELESLWIMVVKAYKFRTFFNFDYLYKILNEYYKYLGTKNQGDYGPLVLAIILQRIGERKKNTFSNNAEFARDYIFNKLEINLSFATEVKKLILSTTKLELPGDELNQTLLRDLQFSRLGGTYDEFLNDQTKIYQERLFLSRLEHFKCQKIIFTEISKLESIFVFFSFKQKYEAKTRENIKQYLKDLDSRIKALEDKEKRESEEMLASSVS